MAAHRHWWLMLFLVTVGQSLEFPSKQFWLGRRNFVGFSAWAPMLLLHPDTSHATLESESVNPELLLQCQNGALSMEQAIPGAYSQACMGIPIRETPVQLPPQSDRHGKQRIVTLRIEQQVAAAGSTGMAIWNSSLLLKLLLERLAESEPDYFRDKTVLELGCGTGLASMTAALLGAKHVFATDGNPLVVDLARRNVETNGLDNKVTTQQLQWGMMDAMDLAESADIVIGADLTYSPGSWRQLAESMETVLTENGVVVYLSLGHTGFNVNAEVDGFLSVTQQQGLESIQPSSLNWPFPRLNKTLSAILLETMSPNDRQVVQSTGGVRVAILRNRIRKTRQLKLLV
jgi:SAM-dependent methyltransferase